MNFCKRMFAVPVFILWSLFLKGCVVTGGETFVHNPFLYNNVSKIIKGQTTRDEVLRYFGTPDVRADGSRTETNPEHPLIRLHQGIASKFGYRLQMEKLLPYSSVDDDHESFFYMEFMSKGIIVVPIGGGQVSNYKNKLLILINKKSGIVDEFAYREEFKTDQSKSEYRVFGVPLSTR